MQKYQRKACGNSGTCGRIANFFSRIFYYVGGTMQALVPNAESLLIFKKEELTPTLIPTSLTPTTTTPPISTTSFTVTTATTASAITLMPATSIPSAADEVYEFFRNIFSSNPALWSFAGINLFMLIARSNFAAKAQDRSNKIGLSLGALSNVTCIATALLDIFKITGYSNPLIFSSLLLDSIANLIFACSDNAGHFKGVFGVKFFLNLVGAAGRLPKIAGDASSVIQKYSLFAGGAAKVLDAMPMNAVEDAVKFCCKDEGNEEYFDCQDIDDDDKISCKDPEKQPLTAGIVVTGNNTESDCDDNEDVVNACGDKANDGGNNCSVQR